MISVSFLIGGGADERTVASQEYQMFYPAPEVLYQVGKILALAVTSGNKYDILSYGFYGCYCRIYSCCL